MCRDEMCMPPRPWDREYPGPGYDINNWRSVSPRNYYETSIGSEKTVKQKDLKSKNKKG